MTTTVTMPLHEYENLKKHKEGKSSITVWVGESERTTFFANEQFAKELEKVKQKQEDFFEKLQKETNERQTLFCEPTKEPTEDNHWGLFFIGLSGGVLGYFLAHLIFKIL